MTRMCGDCDVSFPCYQREPSACIREPLGNNLSSSIHCIVAQVCDKLTPDMRMLLLSIIPNVDIAQRFENPDRGTPIYALYDQRIMRNIGPRNWWAITAFGIEVQKLLVNRRNARDVV